MPQGQQNHAMEQNPAAMAQSWKTTALQFLPRACVGLSPDCILPWDALEASHGLCELCSTAEHSNAAQCCTTALLRDLGCVLKVTVPENRAGFCVWFQEDRGTVAQQALAA